VLFHELGKDLVFALDLGFELLDLGVLGILDGLGLAILGEGEVAILEEVALPEIEEAGRNGAMALTFNVTDWSVRK
jgi:hypothetical protein